MAVGVEGGDGVAAEIDGELFDGEAAGGGVLEVLEYAEAVEALVAGVDEAVAALEVAAQGLPELVGGELLAQEGREGSLDIGVVERWEEVGGGLDGVIAAGGVEGVALVHGVEAAGYGGARAKGHAGGGAPLGPHAEVAVGVVEALEDGARLGELLHEVEVLAALEGRDAADTAVGPGRAYDGGAEGGEGVGAADAEEAEVVVAHVAFVAQHGAVEVVGAAEGVEVGDAEGLGSRMGAEGAEKALEVFGVEVGVGIEADEELVVVAMLEDAVEELFAGIAYATAFAAPAEAWGTAVDDDEGHVAHLGEEPQAALVLFETVAALDVVDAEVEGVVLAGLAAQTVEEPREVVLLGQHGDGDGEVGVHGFELRIKNKKIKSGGGRYFFYVLGGVNVTMLQC